MLEKDNTYSIHPIGRKNRPNIVLILADDLGYGDIGVFGNDAVQTPNLDRLALEGIRFTHHYSGSPMCAPARASLLTGRYPHRTGAIDVVECRGLDRIALSEVTLADLMRSIGYSTGMVGKWHNGAIDPRYYPNARGFDEFVGFRGGFISYWNWVLDYNGSFRRADGRYLTDVFTEEAIGFIDRHHREPFFLYVAYNAPHIPLEAPKEDITPFLKVGKFTKAVSTLYGMIRRMDKGVGRILETLQRYNIVDNTLVLFTSDNGPWLAGEGEMSLKRYNSSFNGMKQDVLEGGIRVPAILHWPAGLQEDNEFNELVHFTDWLPTFLAALGSQAPKDLALDGQSILPLLRGEDGMASMRRFWQWNRYTPVANCNAAMRDGPWKLYRPRIPEAMRKVPGDTERSTFVINNPEKVTDIWRDPVHRQLSPARAPMLFNLDDDPYEQNDLAATHQERVEIMQRELDRWFQTVETERAGIRD